jgi:hypothetical protein
MKQLKFTLFSKQIFCKATSPPRRIFGQVACLRPEYRNCGHARIFRKKIERALLQAVESNRLRRFGRLHEFF